MPKFKLKKWVATGVMLSLPYAAIVDAAGLGRLNVLSQLGQPFAAEIDLVNVTRDELATLKASLASPAAHQAANLSFSPALNALRLSIEKRANGQPYIKATSFRPVSEPYIDMLIDLTWAGGRVTREYSALLDPPGMQVPAPAVTAPVAEAPAPAAPAATPSAAVETPAPTASKPAAPAPKPVAAPAPRPAPAGGNQVAVKSGDTLNAIASSNRPEGVSLEQMLMGIFRANPDAFYGNNINNLRAGKILTIPEREQLASIGQGDASQEVRVHATNWNAYRAKVADTAPAAADATPAAKGKITARVDDKAAPATPKDVVVLSKGDANAGKGGKGDRVRALEEDLAARDKALTESKERIAMLEKTLAEAKKLAEIKTAVTPPVAPATKGAEKAPEKAADKAAPKADPIKAEPPKAEPPKVESPKSEPPKDAKGPEKSVEAPPKAEPPVVVKAEPPAPMKAAPPPPPEPDLIDTVMDNIVPIGGGAAALLAAGGGLWFMRRRKKKSGDEGDADAANVKAEPFRGNAAAAAAYADSSDTSADATVSNVSDVVDPLDEAQVYIDHGRDAQAEDILKEAMVKFPDRNDIPVKLLEVYAARGDKAAFNNLAKQVHVSTGGAGDDWGRVASMGYAIDPTNPLYPSSGNDVVDLTAGAASSTGNIDLDLGDSPTVRGDTDALGTTTDILLDQDAVAAPDDDALNRTMVLTHDEPKTTKVEEPPAVMDFNIDLPAAAPGAESAVAAPAGNMMDFNIDLPAEPAADKTAPPAAPAAKPDDGGLDFKVDFGGINLDLDAPASVPSAPAASLAPSATPAAGGAHDAHWEDVQQKFDLARAYQEMGDKEGALEILQEVVKEGDAGQKAEAQKLMDTLK